MEAKAARPNVTRLHPRVDLLDDAVAHQSARPGSLAMQLRANKNLDRQSLARVVGQATITNQARLFDHANRTLLDHLDAGSHLIRAYADSLTPEELADFEQLRQYFITCVMNATVRTLDDLQQLLTALEIPPAKVKLWEVVLAAVVARPREP